MLILTDAYAGRIDSATAGFPGGRIKNETTPGVSNDGTPLDKDWANNIEGAFQAILDAGAVSPSGAIEQVGASQVLTALQNIINSSGYIAKSEMVGAVQPFYRNSAPSGWVRMWGLTIGNASSGATERANADTEDLFTLIWNEDTGAEVQDSSGSTVSRGVSAAADFAANRRIEIVNMQGDFIRGMDVDRDADPDSPRSLASFQNHEYERHRHDIDYDMKGGSDNNDWGNGEVSSDITNAKTEYSGGDETRPRNRAFLMCIKL